MDPTANLDVMMKRILPSRESIPGSSSRSILTYYIPINICMILSGTFTDVFASFQVPYQDAGTKRSQVRGL
jgi:hypothetical protein